MQSKSVVYLDEPAFAQFEVLNREVFVAFAVNGQIQIEYETKVLFGQPCQE